MAAGACIAAITLAVVTTGRDSAAPTEPGPAAPVPSPAATVDPLEVASAAPTAPSALLTDSARPALLRAGAATAAAILAVRTTSGPDRYVDTAVADEVTEAAGIAIVGVRALILHRAGDRWASPTLVRYAVPVGVRAGSVTALARPWRLPPHNQQIPALRTVPISDAERVRTATAAIVAAGYTAVRDVRLGRAAAVQDIVLASVRAVAPGDTANAIHQLWLTADAARVVGMPETVEPPALQEHP